jgi:hypothetical protein
MSKLRRNLYRAARDLGDIEAAAKGPRTLGKRVARREVYRAEGRFTRRVLRRFGL